MYRFVFIGCILLLPTIGHAENSNKGPSPEVTRALLENVVREEIDQARKTLFERAKERYPSDFKKQEMAVEGLKFVFYNKAYIYYSCARSLKGNFAGQPFFDCASDRLQGAQEAIKLSEYTSLLGNPMILRCELKARLFKAEIEFQPYDFLVREHNGNALVDFEKLNACLLANAN